MKRMYPFVLTLALMATATACDKTQAGNDAPVAAAPRTEPAAAKPEPPIKTVIPRGTHLRVALVDGVSTTKSSPGDVFMASLMEPVVIDGKVVLARGTEFRGKITDVSESGRVKGRAAIRLILTDIKRDGKDVPVVTETFRATAGDTRKRDGEMVGGGAGLGAIVGAIAGGGKGAAIGGLIGGGAGAGTVLATKGKELHYPPETRLTFVLAESLDL